MNVTTSLSGDTQTFKLTGRLSSEDAPEFERHQQHAAIGKILHLTSVISGMIWLVRGCAWANPNSTRFLKTVHYNRDGFVQKQVPDRTRNLNKMTLTLTLSRPTGEGTA